VIHSVELLPEMNTMQCVKRPAYQGCQVKKLKKAILRPNYHQKFVKIIRLKGRISKNIASFALISSKQALNMLLSSTFRKGQKRENG
jgi:hypothetical protein